MMCDEELFERIQSGDIEAFNSLFIRYYSPLCDYASRFIVEVESEDIVQGLMIFIWENGKNLCIENSLRTYLFKSIRNRCLNEIRNKRSHSKVHEVINGKLADTFLEPDYYFVAEELSLKIDKAVAELPDGYRETFEMSRFGEMSNKELSEMLGVSVKTIEYRITQSLKLLRLKLKDYLPD